MLVNDGVIGLDTKLHFSSKEESWETPDEFFQKYNSVYNFTLDVCADDYNHKVDKYFTKEVNGLEQEWSNDVCWMNPPYGRSIIHWMRKAHAEYLKGATVVCLVPARTDTKWWHEYAMKGEITFIRGRLKFNGHKHNAPFPSAVVVFDAK